MYKVQFRAPWHDYTGRCIYMITLRKAELVEDFGRLAGSHLVPRGERGRSYISASRVGQAIKQVLMHFSEMVEPKAQVLHYALMPDHFHFIIYIKEQIEYGLGAVIARFKVAVNQEARLQQVFAKSFNDQILKPDRDLDKIFKYLENNPYRLAVRKVFPEYFQKVLNMDVAGMKMAVYGNLQLLQNPFKDRVVVHRCENEAEREAHRQRWLCNAANGGVLVSPFISPAERSIRKEAEAIGGRTILIRRETFGERFKPAGRDFDLCTQGRLLIIAPWQQYGLKGTVTRQQALALNEIAERVAQG